MRKQQVTTYIEAENQTKITNQKTQEKHEMQKQL